MWPPSIEAEVDAKKGTVQVKRVVCAQDMGLVVNPEGAKIQMEGCATMGLGYALTEEVHFKGGKVLDTNFDTYELPRFSWVPKIETVLIDAKDSPPQGGGEPAIIVDGRGGRQRDLRRDGRAAVPVAHDARARPGRDAEGLSVRQSGEDLCFAAWPNCIRPEWIRLGKCKLDGVPSNPRGSRFFQCIAPAFC